ncbi:MAG: hypothetical protein JXR84_26630 [Anaerolineae bacterium]|nr:hypothetical protein [Anaerolineae bacterium]
MILRRIKFFGCLGLLVIAISACGGTTKQTSTTPTALANSTPVASNDIPISETATVEHFSISTANQTLPEDILREIGYYGGGGPGRNDLCDVECRYATEKHQTPFLISGYASEVLGNNLQVCACGEQFDELTPLTLKFPNNTKILQEDSLIKYEFENEWVCFIQYIYPTQIDDPPGYYTFTLKTNNGIVEHSVHVTILPRVYFDRNNHIISLYHFQPNEHIRLLAYDSCERTSEYAPFGCGILRGWQEYQVDTKGRLTIEVENTYSLAIIGDISGYVIDNYFNVFTSHLTLF